MRNLRPIRAAARAAHHRAQGACALHTTGIGLSARHSRSLRWQAAAIREARGAEQARKVPPLEGFIVSLEVHSRFAHGAGVLDFTPREDALRPRRKRIESMLFRRQINARAGCISAARAMRAKVVGCVTRDDALQPYRRHLKSRAAYLRVTGSDMRNRKNVGSAMHRRCDLLPTCMWKPCPHLVQILGLSSVKGSRHVAHVSASASASSSSSSSRRVSNGAPLPLTLPPPSPPDLPCTGEGGETKEKKVKRETLSL